MEKDISGFIRTAVPLGSCDGVAFCIREHDLSALRLRKIGLSADILVSAYGSICSSNVYWWRLG